MTAEKFILLGGALALDFVNTKIMVRGKPDDLLKTPDDASEWWQMMIEHKRANFNLANGRTEITKEDFELAIKFRSAIRNIFTQVTQGQTVVEADLEMLNSVLSWGSQALVSTAFGVKKVYRLNSPEKNAILYQIALSTVEILSEFDLSRLHQCQNERCILFFYDNTRSATRHWCSTECMNRARSIKNYRLAKNQILGETISKI